MLPLSLISKIKGGSRLPRKAFRSPRTDFEAPDLSQNFEIHFWEIRNSKSETDCTVVLHFPSSFIEKYPHSKIVNLRKLNGLVFPIKLWQQEGTIMHEKSGPYRYTVDIGDGTHWGLPSAVVLTPAVVQVFPEASTPVPACAESSDRGMGVAD